MYIDVCICMYMFHIVGMWHSATNMQLVASAHGCHVQKSVGAFNFNQTVSQLDFR